MTVRERILEKITKAFTPSYLALVNESEMHKGPPGRETHFLLIIVSDRFAQMGLAARQRLIFQTLSEEMKGGVKALAQRTYTPEEWQARGGQEGTGSPPCMGFGR